MRINRLDLLRYGRFTNVSLPFPKENSDLHVIFGPNEAGKSTSLAAVEDLDPLADFGAIAAVLDFDALAAHDFAIGVLDLPLDLFPFDLPGARHCPLDSLAAVAVLCFNA